MDGEKRNDLVYEEMRRFFEWQGGISLHPVQGIPFFPFKWKAVGNERRRSIPFYETIGIVDVEIEIPQLPWHGNTEMEFRLPYPGLSSSDQ